MASFVHACPARAALIASSFVAALVACDERPRGPGPERDPGVPPEEASFVSDETAPAIAEVRPPPLSGGTLLVTQAGRAIVADPDRDRIVVARLPQGPAHDILLAPGDQPGRIVEGARGHVHVVLRGAGAVLTFDEATREVVARHPVCDAPRGLARDAARNQLFVACASGELVTMSETNARRPIISRAVLEPDLRDVVVSGDSLLVSSFRGTTVLVVSRDGAILDRHRPWPTKGSAGVEHAPTTAWRMVPFTDGSAIITHTASLSSEIAIVEQDVQPYGGSSVECLQPVRGELSIVGAGGVSVRPRNRFLSGATLPVDIAASPDGSWVAVVDGARERVVEMSASALVTQEPCFDPVGEVFDEEVPEAVAAAYTPDGLLVIQSREPARLELLQHGARLGTIALGGASSRDTGYDIFHGHDSARALNGMACASCHPEGRDDGHVWRFSDEGLRRTQSLAGTLAGTAPFHWRGDLPELGDVVNETLAERLGGQAQGAERVEALRTWLERIAPVRPSRALAERAGSIDNGRAIYESESAACATCHSGPGSTNNQTMDVGTGETLQVPSLVGIGARAPFMSDGCAPDLYARFDPACGGGDLHGVTSNLTPAEVDDLVAYLLTL